MRWKSSRKSATNMPATCGPRSRRSSAAPIDIKIPQASRPAPAKDKPVAPITSELVIRCLLGAAGFIAGGFWLAQTQTWGPNQFLFRVGGLIMAIFWISQNYTAHLRKSRWQLADLQDSEPGKKPAPPAPAIAVRWQRMPFLGFIGRGERCVGYGAGSSSSFGASGNGCAVNNRPRRPPITMAKRK